MSVATLQSCLIFLNGAPCAALNGLICTVYREGQLEAGQWDKGLTQHVSSSSKGSRSVLSLKQGVRIQTLLSQWILQSTPLPFFPPPPGKKLSATSNPGSTVMWSNVELYRLCTSIRAQLCQNPAALTVIFFFGVTLKGEGEEPENGRKKISNKLYNEMKTAVSLVSTQLPASFQFTAKNQG